VTAYLTLALCLFPDGTYLSVVMDATIRGKRREAILAAAREGRDLAEVPQALTDRGQPAARVVRVIEYDPSWLKLVSKVRSVDEREGVA
jgi:hypothetical protein